MWDSVQVLLSFFICLFLFFFFFFFFFILHIFLKMKAISFENSDNILVCYFQCLNLFRTAGICS